jgi:ectoine hydroxylase-related dioxygenase (phytanoyl-CoA dioxygenase family)
MEKIAHGNWTRELEERGFAIVSEVLPPRAVDELVQQMAAHPVHALRHLIQSIPAVKQIADSPPVRALVDQVLGAKAFVARSIFLDKTPEANWKVAWHQDLTIAVQTKIEVAGFAAWSVKEAVMHVQPPVSILERMLTVRLHLDDCDDSNGALQVIPASHIAGRFDALAIAQWRRENQPTTCLVPRGGALLMRPLLLHASSPARAPKHRRVVHLEFAGDALPGGLKWACYG